MKILHNLKDKTDFKDVPVCGSLWPIPVSSGVKFPLPFTTCFWVRLGGSVLEGFQGHFLF